MKLSTEYLIAIGVLLVLRWAWDRFIDRKLSQDENLEDLGW